MRIRTAAWHEKKGAQFEDYFGIEVPSHYGDFEREYWNLRKGAAVRDVSFFGKIRVTGSDRARFLNSMLSADIKSLTPGAGVRALFLDIKGHIQADMKIYMMHDHLLIVLQPYLVDRLITGLDKYIISEDVVMKNVSEEFAMLQLIGPKADDLLRSRNIQALPGSLYSYQNVTIAGYESHLISLSAGYAILCAAEAAEPLLDALAAPPAGQKAFEVYRVEQGLPLMHRDMDETNFPQESRLDGALDFKKGCYLGQETMARIDAQGHVNRRFMGLASKEPLHPGDRLYRGDREVGKVTSAVHSLLLQQPFALGYVRREYAAENEPLQAGDNRTMVVVRDLPLNG